jgi:hypothetical protein
MKSHYLLDDPKFGYWTERLVEYAIQKGPNNIEDYFDLYKEFE